MCKVSVIIPTYGKPIFLENAICSVQKQTLSDWELIVVDDNNPDTDARIQTEQLLTKFETDNRIKYIQHPCNKNGAAARNTGIAEARGEYISFLDSDDEYFPTRLEQCCEKLDNCESNIAGVYTGCEFRRDGKVFHTETNVKSGNFLLETLACTFMFCTGSNLFIRKEAVDAVNGFDESFLRHQDYEFLVRIFERYSLVALPEVLVIKNNENVNVPNVEKMKSIKEQYLEKYQEIIDALPEMQKQYVYHSQYIQIAEAALRTKKNNLAKEYYDKAVRSGKLTLKEKARRIAFTLLKKKI